MVRFLVIRHGETEWNSAGRIQGQLESPLNERGLEQADAVAAYLADEPVHELWSSDLGRARTTASRIARRNAQLLRLDTRLRERHFGIFQGLTFNEAKKRYPEDYAAYESNDPEEAIPGGESLREFYDRSLGFFTELARAQKERRTIVVVTHGGVVSCLYRHAKQIALTHPREWQLPNAAVNEFSYERGKWRVLRFADVEHLEEVLDDI